MARSLKLCLIAAALPCLCLATAVLATGVLASIRIDHRISKDTERNRIVLTAIRRCKYLYVLGAWEHVKEVEDGAPGCALLGFAQTTTGR